MAAQPLDDLTPFLETIQALNDEIKKGRIRAYGLSNDTAWGLMRYLWEADKNGLIAPITVQNPYSLLNRLYEVAMAEITHRENVVYWLIHRLALVSYLVNISMANVQRVRV